MLGQPLLGGRLRDVRGVIGYLRQRSDLDGKRLALWGDSFAPVNPADKEVRVPWDANALPEQAEPLGGLLALFGGLYEEGVRAVYVRGGLVQFRSVLDSPFLYLPHDIIVPGALTVSDLGEVATAGSARSLRLEGLVDARNQPASAEEMNRAYEPVRKALGKDHARFRVAAKVSADKDVVEWLLTGLKEP
jgi:hypothetical protein